MDSYEIIITPNAESDLIDLRNYIADVLLVPDVARSYIQAIRKELTSLREMPERIKPVTEEPWHSRGLRKIIVKNFYVYFRIDELTHRVYVLNVIYSQRDQLKQMSKIRI